MYKDCIITFTVMLFFFGNPLFGQNIYKLSDDSQTKPNVKYGIHITTHFSNSKIFPGTIRNIDVYVPDGYDGKTPATLCLFQDGMLYNADIVVSNLIEKNELPMMILIAVSPGWIPGDYDAESPRANRTYEYDTPSSRYGEFLLKELLPFVETLKTPDGRNIILSSDREDRMITGCSSGAACAFNVAWTTNAFSRVYSSCGSFTGLRGSFTNATLVHKFEPKPIRFFFQSGTLDMWTSFGDWWSANQAMVRAMDFAGFDFDYKFTENANHCDEDISQIFPDVLRFLWKEYPENSPSPKHKNRNGMMNQILIDGETFEEVSKFQRSDFNLISVNGELFATSDSGTWLLNEQAQMDTLYSDKRILAFGENGTALTYCKRTGLEFIDREKKTVKKVKKKIYPYVAAASRNGHFYIIGALSKYEKPRSLWHLSPDGELSAVDEELRGAQSIGISANNNWLYTFEYNTRRGFSYLIEEEGGALKYKQEFFYIHIPDEKDGAEITSCICDNSGRTYLATNMGIQVCDYNGRSEAILTLPDNVRPLSIAWGGKERDYLYILGDNHILYRRKLNVKGASINEEIPKIRVSAG